MKLIIASDIHGSAYWCGKLMDVIEAEAPDRVILLGDILYHGPRNDLPRDYAPKKVIPMLNNLADRVTAVRGNCDAEVDQMVLDFPLMDDYRCLTVDDTLLFCSHGHVKAPHDVSSLPAGCRMSVSSEGVKLPQGSMALFGHTHIQQNEVIDGVRFINPGSVSIPKDGVNGYALYEDGTVTLHALQGDSA